MNAPNRTLLGKFASLAARNAIYETPEGFVVETRAGYDVTERRVLYDDVLLVTMHRRYGVAYLVVTGLITLFFVVLALTTYRSVPEGAAAWIVAAFGLPSLISFLVRALFGVETITIFGRRSKAAIGFRFRKQRAREVYERICLLVRNAQQRVVSVPEDRPDDVSGTLPV
jgi:hypothetical protein